MSRKFVEMKADFLSYQKGVVYFFDDPKVGPNPADRIVRRGFGKLVADPALEGQEESADEVDEVETAPEPIRALGDAGEEDERAALMEKAKDLGIPNYWAMKNSTLASAIQEKEEEAE